MADERFRLDWFAGASAQVELFSPEAKGTNEYQLKYTPPFRSTIRPPLEKRLLGRGELTPINEELDKLVATLDARAAAANAAQAPATPDNVAIDQMTLLGNILLDLVIPNYVQADLRSGGLFLEIGMDKHLLKYPWELMHDGDDFLCLKHAVGRFVNGAPLTSPMQERPAARLGSALDMLKILIISVPKPQERPNLKYDRLPQAEKETEAICDTLSGIDGVNIIEPLIGKKATYNDVYLALKQHEPQIIHYNGHAYFDEEHAHNSALVLFDRDLTTGAIANFFSKKPPILCFVNACETAKEAKPRKNRYDIFGLAEAFLSTDAYLLGSRWKINDKAAAGFAKQFYLSLIKEGKSLGTSILEARRACKDEAPDDEFAWASYVFYGDPRVCFRRL